MKESTLIEISRIILASLVFTGAITILGFFLVWVPLLRDFVSHGLAILESPRVMLAFFTATAVTSVLACLAAYGIACWKWKDTKAPITPGRVWHQAFDKWAPKNGVPPYLTVEMVNGIVWRGFFVSFDQDPEDTQRSLALKAPLKRKRPIPEGQRPIFRRPQQPGFIDQPASEQFVLLPEAQIVSIKIEYLSPDPT